MSFVDVDGHVALVGCHPRSYQESGGAGVDRARWDVDFAVLDVVDPTVYATIHGFRSEIDGLGAGMRIDTIDHGFDEEDEGPFLSYRLRYRAPVTVNTTMDTQILPTPTPRSGSHADETILTERTYVETSTDEDFCGATTSISMSPFAIRHSPFATSSASPRGDPSASSHTRPVGTTTRASAGRRTPGQYRLARRRLFPHAAAPESAHRYGMLFSYADVSLAA